MTSITLSWFSGTAATNFSSDLLHSYAYLVNFNNGKPKYLRALRAVEKLRIYDVPKPCTGDHGGGEHGHSHDHNHGQGSEEPTDSAAAAFAAAVHSLSVRIETLKMVASRHIAQLHYHLDCSWCSALATRWCPVNGGYCEA